MICWRRPDLDPQLDAELRDHIERLTADHLAAGMPEAEARRRARLEFGGVEQVKEASYDDAEDVGTARSRIGHGRTQI